MSLGLRTPQLRAPFSPGDPARGYYNDLRVFVAERAATSEEALRAFEAMTAERRLANPISIAQLGLGSWQLAPADAAWLGVTRAVCDWLVRELDEAGRIPFRFALRGTYSLDPPWHSAMAQGEAASLLVRGALALGRPDLREAAELAAAPLLDPAHGLVSQTPEGPVLEEYPTDPPAHVLNGWIFALWGLYDLAADGGGARPREAFEAGAAAVAARLHLYRTPPRWSLYDLYPHPVANVASPFYHRLHAEQLFALDALAPSPALREQAQRWTSSAASPWLRTAAVTRKLLFRVVRPRRKPH